LKESSSSFCTACFSGEYPSKLDWWILL
jgi:glutamine phosphoribosylpyrophosphate amidotransferase